METLSAPGHQELPDVLQRPDAAPDGQRHEDLLGRSSDHVQDDVPLVGGRGDVQKRQLVGPLPVIERGVLHGVPGVGQVDEIDPLDDPPVFHVQARYDSLGQHDLIYCPCV